MARRALKEKYKKCLSNMRETANLASVGGLLSWDQETMMPQRGAKIRSEQTAAIAGIVHDKFIDPVIGKMLKELSKNSKRLTSTQAAIVRERLRDYKKATRLPPELVRELARVSSIAQHVWIEARKKSDFKAFAPWLKKTVELKQRQADCYGYEDHPYDALMDDYEPYMTVAQLDPIMDELRRGIVALETAIQNSRTSIDTRLLKQRFPAPAQEALCKEVMQLMGVDLQASRMDRSAHPFCAGISSPYDVRITNRYNERYLPQALYGVIHESGHALYEQGLEEKFYGTPLGEAVSLGIHESQSRFWENIVGRSKPFVTFIFPRLKKYFPQALKGFRPEQFYRAVNQVAPCPIRIESDEITYSLHIIMRYQIEKGLLKDEIKVRDLPEIWNDMMKRYIGIRPKNDAEGVLQDTHWASGLFGYFPTYLLGNLYGAQLWYKLSSDIPRVNSKIAQGNFKPILTWLRKKIHYPGRRYKPSNLIRRATGHPPQAKYFLSYLKDKFSEIYR